MSGIEEFLWDTYMNTDIAGGPPLTKITQERKWTKNNEAQKYPAHTCHGVILI
jgi:hypothetical protein